MFLTDLFEIGPSHVKLKTPKEDVVVCDIQMRSMLLFDQRRELLGDRRDHVTRRRTSPRDDMLPLQQS